MLDKPLLEVMWIASGCTYLSDLSDFKYLSEGCRASLLRALEDIPPDATPLSEWNDALQYLAQESPQPTREAARGRLIGALKNR